MAVDWEIGDKCLKAESVIIYLLILDNGNTVGHALYFPETYSLMNVKT